MDQTGMEGNGVEPDRACCQVAKSLFKYTVEGNLLRFAINFLQHFQVTRSDNAISKSPIKEDYQRVEKKEEEGRVESLIGPQIKGREGVEFATQHFRRS